MTLFPIGNHKFVGLLVLKLASVWYYLNCFLNCYRHEFQLQPVNSYRNNISDTAFSSHLGYNKICFELVLL